MSPIAALRFALNADRRTLRAAVARVPTSLLTVKPAPDRWSVAEVLEHLSIVERGALMRVRGLIQEAPVVDAPTALTPIDRDFLQNRAKRIMAPERIKPTGTMSIDAALAALESSREELLAILHEAEGRDLSKATQPHPALGPLDGYQWIALIGGHEMRHALQIDEIAAGLMGHA
ncbi:MAG: DinB family protein [Vicinamibacterales bacterium]